MSEARGARDVEEVHFAGVTHVHTQDLVRLSGGKGSA